MQNESWNPLKRNDCESIFSGYDGHVNASCCFVFQVFQFTFVISNDISKYNKLEMHERDRFGWWT